MTLHPLKQSQPPPTSNNRFENMQKKPTCNYNDFFIYSMSLLFLIFVQNTAIKTGKLVL
jgi:hypothetical protein